MNTREKYKIRKSTKYVIILVLIVLLVFSLSNLIIEFHHEKMSLTNKQIYQYTNKFNYDYQINLISNKYLTDKEVENKDLAYVTDLIDNIKINLNYEYLADKETEVKYNYSIIGKMQAFYTKDGEEQKIWDKEETLLDEKNFDNVSNNITINEILLLDLKDKNDLINSFKQQLGMSINAKYTVVLKVQTSTNIEEKDVTNEIKPIVNINLAEKTTKITGDNNIENTEYISKQYNSSEKSNVLLIIFNLILIAGEIALLRYAIKAKVKNTIRNEYKYELNRILRICQDKIVKVSTKPNDEGLEVVHVKDFGEMLKVSEELFKPILYYSEPENEKAWFSVMSGKTSYRYILEK